MSKKCSSFYEVQQKYVGDGASEDEFFTTCYVLQDQLPKDHPNYREAGPHDEDRWDLNDMRARFDDVNVALYVRDDVSRRHDEMRQERGQHVDYSFRVVRVTERVIA